MENIVPSFVIKNGDTGVGIIALERMRQVLEEGWSAEHDDQHTKGELAQAAACYALSDAVRSDGNIQEDGPNYPAPWFWPWDRKWWKPTPEDRIRELAKAGALSAAEIDRLLRVQDKQEPDEGECYLEDCCGRVKGGYCTKCGQDNQ